MTAFIDEHKECFGVEPICRELQFAPSTYYAARARPPSKRQVEDARLTVEIRRVYTENYSVYGARKVWLQLLREGIVCGRDRVARLMRAAGLRGVTRGAVKRTTICDVQAERAPDLVQRHFWASRPDQLWVTDFERHEALLDRAVVKGTAVGSSQRAG